MRPIAIVSTTVLVVAVLSCSACADSATTESDTVDMFARGMELVSQGSEPTLREAIDVFSSCVEVAPDYAPCHAGLARTYSSMSGGHSIMPPAEAWPAARQAAEKAVELDGNLALAHVVLAGVIAGQDWDWAGAEREYLRAVELAPNDIGTLIRHAWFLFSIGRDEEALTTIARLRELEFSDPYLEYRLTGDAERAKEAAAELIVSDPENPEAYWGSAVLHAGEGDFEQAAEHLQKQIPLMDGDAVDEVALLGHVFARMGRDAEARQMLERLDELSSEGRYVSPANKAWIHAGLGEVDETLSLLREGIESHANRSGLQMRYFAFVFEPISDDPRFSTLLEELGLTYQTNRSSND